MARLHTGYIDEDDCIGDSLGPELGGTSGTINENFYNLDNAIQSLSADGAVTERLLGTGSVTSSKIANNAVTSAALSAGAITTDKIALSAVTANRINLVTSLSSNGYQIMPGGLIMQWGNTGTSGYFNSPGKRLLVNFPIPFPNACLNVQGTAYVYNVGTYVAVPEIYSLSNTQVGWQDGDNDNTPWDIYWLAIGY